MSRVVVYSRNKNNINICSIYKFTNNKTRISEATPEQVHKKLAVRTVEAIAIVRTLMIWKQWTNDNSNSYTSINDEKETNYYLYLKLTATYSFWSFFISHLQTQKHSFFCHLFNSWLLRLIFITLYAYLTLYVAVVDSFFLTCNKTDPLILIFVIKLYRRICLMFFYIPPFHVFVIEFTGGSSDSFYILSIYFIASILTIREEMKLKKETWNKWFEFSRKSSYWNTKVSGIKIWLRQT